MASDPDLWTYLLLEHLPTESECVQAIVNVSSLYGSKKQKDTIQNFACSLHNMWVQSFTEKHVITLKYVKVKLTDQVKIYATKVQKAKGNRQLNIKEWMKQSNKLFDLLKKNI